MNAGTKAKVALAVMSLAVVFNAASAGAASARYMILINEKNMGAYSMGDAERVVTEYLLSRGAEVIDSELVKTNINRDKALQAMSSGPQAAAALGLQFGADVIIVGKAIAKGSADRVQDTSFRSYTANVSLKAIRTDTAEILNSDMAQAAKIHVDDNIGGSQAIQTATSALVAKFMPQVFSKTGATTAANNVPKKVQLVMGDVTQLWQVAALKKLMREKISGVTDVVQRSFVSGVATFDVHLKGDSQRLAEALTLADPGYFRIKVVGVTQNKLDARLVETQP